MSSKLFRWLMAWNAAAYAFIESRLNFMWPFIDTWLLFLVDVLRLFSGRFKAQNVEKCVRPKKLLELYEYTGNAECKVVRETLSVLDLDHMVFPCPLETLVADHQVILNSRYRTAVKKHEDGVVRLPLLVDENTSAKVIGAEDINAYLWSTYGKGATPPLNYRLANANATVQTFTGALCLMCRPIVDMGIVRGASHLPAKPLELFGYEGSPFVRRVQEVLTRCEIPYVFRVFPWGSEEKRAAFLKEHESVLPPSRKNWGLIKVPLLRDPNTQMDVFESSAIVAYLEDKYQTTIARRDSWLE